MINLIGYYPVLGIPLVTLVGILTLFLLITTIISAVLMQKGKLKITVKHHKVLATLTVIFALIHAFFGLAAYF